MPRKSSPGGEPVTRLTLDRPGHDEDYYHHHHHHHHPDDPLRDPLLPPPPRASSATTSQPPPKNPKELDTPNTTTAPDDGSPNNSSSLRSRRQQRGPSRVLDRDAAFYQSRGRWRVQNLRREAARFRYDETTGQTPPRRLPLTKRVWDDWFYSLAYQRTIVLMMILFVSYGAIVVAFAFVYLGVSLLGQERKVNPDGSVSVLPFCDMDIHDHMEALYFSLSTMTTIGYGVSDYYFGGCWTPLMLVLAQVCCAITFDAVAIGLLFQRISRGHKRGKSILFSNRAVIQRVSDKLYLMFRIGELRHHQLHGASVKAFCIRHERTAVRTIDSGNDAAANSATSPTVHTTHFVTRPLPLWHEKAAGNGNVLMSLPQVMAHCLDESSPLSQPDQWYDESGIQHFATSRKRQPDGSEESNTTRNLATPSQVETSETEAFLRDRQAEIVILVEGTDELTGAAIQARHSYSVRDLAWNHALAPCIFPYQEERFQVRQSTWFRRRTLPTCVVDFNAFHDLMPVPDNVDESPYLYQ